MLVTMDALLQEAKKQKYAVGAFNIANLESLQAVIEAAEEEKKPVIIQYADLHNIYIPFQVIAPIMLSFAKNASVPVCVHLDHGESFDLCMQAMKLGFTSVMFDASAKSYEENVAGTREVVKAARALGVSVEAELGRMPASELGGGEGRADQNPAAGEDSYTNPDQAKAFVEATGVNALAIAFGTVHGVYLSEPKLNLNRITEIKSKIDIPLVMHGGSGVSEEDFKTAIANGITKINYYTYMAMAGGKAVKEAVTKSDTVFYHDLAMTGIAAMKENARAAMRVFCG